MKLLPDIAKEFKSLITFCVISGFALVFLYAGAQDMATGFCGGALAVITDRSTSRAKQTDQPPK